MSLREIYIVNKWQSSDLNAGLYSFIQKYLWSTAVCPVVRREVGMQQRLRQSKDPRAHKPVFFPQLALNF